MKKFSLVDASRSVKSSLSKHSPEILTGLGIAGMLTTTVLAVKATPKAMSLLDEAKKDKSDDEQLTVKETVKTAYKCYIPAAAVATASIACLVGASRVSLKRNAVLATAYKLVETAHKEYREQVIETIGEKKEAAIRDKVAKKQLEKNPVKDNTVLITSKGDTLCYDSISGRYFKADIDRIKRAENDLNRRMRNDNYISLNEFYSEIGLSPINIGDELGWNIDKGYIDLHLTSQLTDDDTPCVVISFYVAPERDYYKMF